MAGVAAPAAAMETAAVLEVGAALLEAAAHMDQVGDLGLVGAAATGRAVEADRAALRTVTPMAAPVAAVAAVGHQMEVVALHRRVQHSRTLALVA
jgi:hypothetical protein